MKKEQFHGGVPESKIRRLNFIASFLAAIVVLTVSVSSSWAWYEINRRVENEQLNIASDSELVEVSAYSIYMANDRADLSDFQLNSYDSIFKKHKNTEAFVVLELKGQAVRETGHPLTFTISCNGNLLEDEKPGKIARNFSNISQIQCKKLSGLPTDYASLQSEDWEETVAPAMTFASYEVNGETGVLKDGSTKGNMDVAITLTKSDCMEPLYVAFRLDYSDKLMSQYVMNYNGGSARFDLTNANDLKFEADLEKIVVSTN